MMSTQQRARTLMMRQQLVKENRQQSMLKRVASEIGVEIDNNDKKFN